MQVGKKDQNESSPLEPNHIRISCGYAFQVITEFLIHSFTCRTKNIQNCYIEPFLDRVPDYKGDFITPRSKPGLGLQLSISRVGGAS